MTLNGVMALILCYFTEFGSFNSRAHCVEVVEDVVVKRFTFAISSPDEFLVNTGNHNLHGHSTFIGACTHIA